MRPSARRSVRPHTFSGRPAVAVGLAVALAVPVGAAVAAPVIAAAGPDAGHVVISEAYLVGGSSGQPYRNKFIELHNPTSEPVSLDGWSVQYKSATGASFTGITALSGTIAAGGHFLVQGGSNATNGEPLPSPDVVGTLNPSGTSGVLALASQATAVTPAKGALPAEGVAGVVDLLGYGTADTFEVAAAPAGQGTGVVGSLNRSGSANDNSADFAFSAQVTPTSSSTGAEPSPTPTPSPTPSVSTPPATITPIAEIQGTGDASPLAGTTVTTRGVVTAVYPTGGFNGLYLQTAGTGGTQDATPGASDGVFVFSAAAAQELRKGDHVQVTGAVSEWNGLTQLTPAAGGWTVLTEPATVEPAAVSWPAGEAGREALEGMLLAPQGDFTVTNNYDTNYYGTIGLAAGDSPLLQPTSVGRPLSAEYEAQLADNEARRVLLDDGSTWNYNSTANKSQPLPWLTGGAPVRVGAAVTFTRPVVLDYRYGAWGLQPTAQLTPAVADAVQPTTFENTRQDAPAEVGGALQVGTFNVLNYFSTTGDELTGCTYYTDRAGDPVTVSGGCDVRGAAENEDLARQQVKIVKAISALGADVVALLEIENSAHFLGKTRDQALSDLTDALNAHDGAGTWAYVASPAEVPASEDVIRNGFVYRTAAAEPVGESSILVGDEAFGNARQPLAQAFQPAGGAEGGADDVLVIANHFKSKGSPGPWPGDTDQGDGQGNSNESRVRQATSLVAFADAQAEAAGTDKVLLVGDFNAYEQEDPIKVMTDAGYTDLGAATGEYTYSYKGLAGSLDHVLASPAAAELVTGTDIWNINAYEPVANEYSRHNYNATILYDETPFRSSDHDPVLVGLGLDGGTGAPTTTIDLVDINDFHGRIDANTVAFAGTVEQIREQNPDGTAFVSAGDNIGASLFASSVAKDKPTLDVLNALDLTASAVGNHEFDQGMSDLTGRVSDAAEFEYLGANVYDAATGAVALPEYEVQEIGGVDVGFVGVVTQETPTLVTPAGVAGLEFGDPVAALNRVTAQLKDGDAANGEADVVIALAHDGAGAGTPDGSTLQEELAAGGPFADLVQNTDARVAAIFTGHTHKQYAWDAPVPGTEGKTRPVIQTGNYGEFVGHVSLTVDKASGEVTAYTAQNVARTRTPAADLIAAYPRVAAVNDIVKAALAEAQVIGAQPVGKVTADITTAFSGGSYVDGVWTGGNRDDRASESALGNLVANSLRDSLSAPERGGADIGVANPGGLRNELYHGADGVITYAEANAVLPFVNNLWTVTLTGAQLDELLEQQWQTDKDGNRPSRPYLALGLSDNVTYTATTADPNATPGDNVSSIMIDGVPVDPAAEYRVATFSFLVSGGDNFRAFTQGTDGRDSGLVDRDAWMDYIGDNSPLSPSFARSHAVVGALPGTVTAGDDVSVKISQLDLTSLGSPRNTQAEAFLVPAGGTAEGVSLGSFPVTEGATSVAVTVPAGTAGGEYVLEVVAEPSGTTVALPVTVEEPLPAAPAWHPWKLYWWGDQVTYDGHVWEARRVNFHSTPGARKHSPWVLVK